MPKPRTPASGAESRSARRPSPILVPGKEKPSLVGKIRDWLRALPGIGHKPSAPPPDAPAIPTSEPRKSGAPEPEATGAASNPEVSEGQPEDSSASLPTIATPSHRTTVQMLPGRLEPLLPEVIQQEVRFQRAPGIEQEVTLGWELGEPPHHVTLDHPSIQPLHAKMTFQNGNWMIESLATNDPVEINGTPVSASAGPYLLATGDQVRIGEALFRFFLP